MNAINLIRKKGGLSKTDPNQVKSGLEKRKSMKRPLEDEGILILLNVNLRLVKLENS